MAFLEERRPNFPVYTDPERRVFAAAGLKRTKAAVLHPGAIAAGVRAFGAGYRQAGVKGDPWQLGGVLVVSTTGEVLHRHVEAHPGHAADIDAVLAACREAG